VLEVRNDGGVRPAVRRHADEAARSTCSGAACGSTRERAVM
jgi:hypothetical protein